MLGQVQREERGAQSHGGQQPWCGKAGLVSGLLVSWRTVSPYQGLNWGIPEHPDRGPVVWLASVEPWVTLMWHGWRGGNQAGRFGEAPLGDWEFCWPGSGEVCWEPRTMYVLGVPFLWVIHSGVLQAPLTIAGC